MTRKARASAVCAWAGSTIGRAQLTVAVENEINGGNPAVPCNDEISPGVSWRLIRAARYPLDPPAIAQFLGLGNWPISKVRMSSLDRADDAMDLVAATVDAPGLGERAVFGEDLVDGRAPTRGVVFTEDVVKIAGQQGRYAVGHGLSPLGIECGLRYLDPERSPSSIIRCFVST